MANGKSLGRFRVAMKYFKNGTMKVDTPKGGSKTSIFDKVRVPGNGEGTGPKSSKK